MLVGRHAPFCLAHVSDTSCWSYLLFLFFKVAENRDPIITDPGSSKKHLFDITKDAMCFAHGTARGHESIWAFLRTVLASGELLEDEQRVYLIELVEGWVREDESVIGSEEAKERELEKKALEWIRRRGRTRS